MYNNSTKDGREELGIYFCNFLITEEELYYLKIN